MKTGLVSILAIFFANFASGQFWYSKTLNSSEVAKRWGKTTLNIEKFNNSNISTKASMAYSILRNEKKYIGKSVIDIHKEFGQPDGFYFSDIIPAYLIQIAKTKNKEAWQIVFLLDHNRKVTKVIVHKNN